MAKAAAEDARPPRNPYLASAHKNGFIPDTPSEGYVDTSILYQQVVGDEHLEKVRQEALKLLQTSSIAPPLAAGCEQLMARILRKYVHLELRERSMAAEKDAAAVLKALQRHTPAKRADTPETITIGDSPQKFRAGIGKLSAPASGEAYIQAMNLEWAQAIEKLSSTLNKLAATKADHKDAYVPTIGDEGCDILRALLDAQAKMSKSEHTADGFAVFCSKAVHKAISAYNVAKEKGEHEVAIKLLQAIMDAKERIKQFMAVAEVLGFKESRRLYQSIDNPLDNMDAAAWNHVASLATSGLYRQALQSLGGASPTSKFGPQRKARVPSNTADSDSDESSREGGAARKRKRAAPYCTFCKVKGHNRGNCKKLQNKKDKPEHNKN